MLPSSPLSLCKMFSNVAIPRNVPVNRDDEFSRDPRAHYNKATPAALAKAPSLSSPRLCGEKPINRMNDKVREG